ncbi:hypothetical protein K7W42_17650 [Deinococcus sp. HMF7604]|uniref:hypothetical protein n=1 Tax=Deinococcus betulae TaxID=2873312 RepID=UPI001CCF702F|nr:hypothetical protein [Deinococcus betulae]MBZ9752670.1 hypothetical protein [Deinococcus betulae]
MKSVNVSYFAVGARPIKVIHLDDRVLAGTPYAMDWIDGSFRIDHSYMDNIWGPPLNDDADTQEMTQQAFEKMVQHYRLEKGLNDCDNSEFENGLRYYRDVLAKG